ncbi:hypothetical protein GCM10007898_25210 [Dyella flagellata]|uniref:Uncharacterized protein n=1 Tax=Dyella flagellata TaxID=1867833 RepID=A0ABQ5XEI3_9GAMM|nr:hypothetical protein GCM10007898_25210 [Dyella flagellata]
MDSRFRGNDGIWGTYAGKGKTWGYLRVCTPTYFGGTKRKRDGSCLGLGDIIRSISCGGRPRE